MRTLVINLTRFGDLLQTQPVISELRGQGDEVGLLCLQNFQEAAGLMRDLDFQASVPGARLLAALDSGWPGALGEFWKFVGSLRREAGFDRVINLTSSLPARLLCAHLKPGQTLGFALDEFGFGVNSSPWAAFLEASSLCRGSSPFNLVDLFRRAAHLPPGRGEFALRRLDAALIERLSSQILDQAPAGTLGYVCLQLGASAEVRRWPVGYFARLGQLIYNEFRLVPVLLGGPGEEGLAARYAAATDAPFVSLVGRTSLSELAAALCGAKLLVSNDTGTMHLAAGLDLPLVGIFLATAQPFDTGPYRAGCLCLEPDLDCHPCAFGGTCGRDNLCRAKIEPDTLFSWVKSFLEKGDFTAGQANGQLRAWLTRPQPDSMLGLTSLSGHENQDRSLWIGLQRHFYRQFLDEEPFRQPAGMTRLSPQGAARISGELAQAGQLLELLAGQGAVLVKTAMPSMKTKFMATWQKLHTRMRAAQDFAVLGQLWLYQSQEIGQDFPRFLKLLLRYRELVAALGLAASTPD